jgi:hypothetical protein
MQKFKYILDNIIGRCPSCYYNFLQILCEMACSPNQDQFIWPLETINITRPIENNQHSPDQSGRADWALDDYVDPEDEEGVQEDNEAKEKVTAKPIETVQVVRKIRYFISEKQAQDFIDSCW